MTNSGNARCRVWEMIQVTTWDLVVDLFLFLKKRIFCRTAFKGVIASKDYAWFL